MTEWKKIYIYIQYVYLYTWERKRQRANACDEGVKSWTLKLSSLIWAKRVVRDKNIHSAGFMNFNQAFDECNHGGNWSTEAGPFCLMIVGHWEQAVQPPEWIALGWKELCQHYWTPIYSLLNTAWHVVLRLPSLIFPQHCFSVHLSLSASYWDSLRRRLTERARCEK